MIKQDHFSELIKELLMERLPVFCPTIEYKDDGSFDCDLRNPSNEFSIWIATYNSEITLGIEAPDGSTDIHTHISCYEEEDLEDAFNDMIHMINEIRVGKTILYQTENSTYQWTKNIELPVKNE
ncbi:hypothetical protein [Psychroflexus sp. MES1-P1E]|uniref:hypothetical protein n=1 Tax=Psychroflexus sp. MES1-P1E TaxID=2058320 RepID=UPI000C7E054D|nr:hypothetical protein [Psychroflexus sp. MES1-P1E]PKG43624.1 hypothetical protein CXF67_04010 [Psychroflexus sp. MES1-P1E]